MEPLEHLFRRLFPHLYSLLQDIRLKLGIIIQQQGTLMGKNDDLNKKLDELQTSLDERQAANAKAAEDLRATIADLTQQLNTGEAGLTPAQVDAAISRLGVIQADLQGDEPTPTA
jgi:hypothetical protein